MDPSTLWREYEEKIAEVKKKDSANRGDAFLTLQASVLGIPIEPITAYRLLVLEQIGSPYLSGGEISPQDLSEFMWVLNADFCLDEKKSAAFHKKHNFTMGDVEKSEPEISEILEACFGLAVNHGSSSRGRSDEHWISQIIDLIAREYGWSLDEILALPLSIAFQLTHTISNRYQALSGEPPVVFNKKIDALKAEYMNRVKEMRN